MYKSLKKIFFFVAILCCIGSFPSDVLAQRVSSNDSSVVKSVASQTASDGGVINADSKLSTVENSTPQMQHKNVPSSKGLEGLGLVVLVVALGFLIVLALLFSLIGNVVSGVNSKKKENQTEDCLECVEVSGDVAAAIGFVMSQYIKDLHADETNIITIRKVARAYSPWSSKIYQIRKSPRY